MALQVWLPLDGNLNNLGLSNVSITVSGTTSYTDSGKIGKGLSANGSSYWTISPITLGTTASMTWWAKTSDTSAMFWVLNASVYSNLNFWLYNGAYYLNSGNSTQNPFQNNGTNVSGLSDNIWHHYATVFNGSTCDLYIDGTYYGSAKTYKSPATGSNSSIKLGGGFTNGHSYDVLGTFNDFRIYDHCLSQAEVKEISKGLVLHYKLDDIINPNLINNSYNFYVNAGNDQVNSSVSTYIEDNTAVTKVERTAATGSAYYYRWITSNLSSFPLQNSTTYTVSAEIKSNCEGRFGIDLRPSNTSNYQINYTNTNEKWQRFSATFTTKSNASSDTSALCLLGVGSLTGDYACVRNIKLELGSVVTPYTRSNEELSIVYDCSGFGNNGTITGEPQSEGNSSRYNTCIHLHDEVSAIEIGNLSTMVPEKIFTFNIWFKRITGEWSSKPWETILGGPSGFEIETKNSGGSSCYIVAYSWGGNSASLYIPYEINTWNMLTMTRTTSETKFYLNGELKYTGTAGSIPSGSYFLGSWKTAVQLNYKGCLSDARIYSTILSEDDIKQLYSLGARIDDKKNLHTGLIVEYLTENLVSPYTYPVVTNTVVKFFQQTNCLVTVSDNSYRIYRPPNISGNLNGNSGGVMNYGGVYLRNDNNVLGLLQNHKYIFMFDVKGVSDTALTISITNYMGWPGGGLTPNETTDKFNRVNPVTQSFNSSDWKVCALYFEINTGLYKECTSAYSSFVAGLTYLSFRDFEIRFPYSQTTSVGTDVYIKNIRLYDVTNIDLKQKINQNTNFLGLDFIEFDNASLVKFGDVIANNIYEI